MTDKPSDRAMEAAREFMEFRAGVHHHDLARLLDRYAAEQTADLRQRNMDLERALERATSGDDKGLIRHLLDGIESASVRLGELGVGDQTTIRWRLMGLSIAARRALGMPELEDDDAKQKQGPHRPTVRVSVWRRVYRLAQGRQGR